MPDSAHDPAPASDVSYIEPAPTNLLGILTRLGPGLILTGSIVGSGELIATPAVAAEAGFILLWLIILGTVIKIFAQVEFGRFAICNGQAALWGMNDVPGPRVTVWQSGAGKLQANWLNWYWIVMFLTSLAQLGGIVGGVGQALAISIPLTEEGRAYNAVVDRRARANLKLAVKRYDLKEGTAANADAVPEPTEADLPENPLDLHMLVLALEWEAKGLAGDAFNQVDANGDGSVTLHDAAPGDDQLKAWFDRRAAGKPEITAADLVDTDPHKFHGTFSAWDSNADKSVGWAELSGYRAALVDHFLAHFGKGEKTVTADAFKKRPPSLQDQTRDDRYWAFVVTVVTAILLVWGHYSFIEWTSTGLVVTFTFMTIGCLVMLQMVGAWAIRAEDIVEGLSFRLPPADSKGLATALFTFGIIGVGANELIQYPSWCLEKGYARSTGPRDDSPEWAERANGWLNVMQWDAWCSMGVYTFATIAFYLLAAATLWRLGMGAPQGNDMIRTLSSMYEPVFGTWTQIVFLIGAFAVLYSTFFAATAGHARVGADAIRIFTETPADDESYQTWVARMSAVFPFISLGIYVLYPEPKFLVLISACLQAIMLPMLALTALYFRYYRTDERVAPGIVWDICLWISFLVLIASGGFAAWYKLTGH